MLGGGRVRGGLREDREDSGPRAVLGTPAQAVSQTALTLSHVLAYAAGQALTSQKSSVSSAMSGESTLSLRLRCLHGFERVRLSLFLALELGTWVQARLCHLLAV